MGNKVENKWIDFSSLPRSKSGSRIRWDKSVGCLISFMYGEYQGTLRIVERVGARNYRVVINIGAEEIEYVFNASHLYHCQLGGAFVKPIAITHPDLVKYFVNKEDAYKYSAYSKVEVDMICPLCGAIRKKQIMVLTNYGLACPACSDGVSYPNKFMYHLLKQLDIVFINELTKKYPGFEWTKNYRYDFYFKISEKQYIVEMDGGFHFRDIYSTCFDNEKDKIATRNGVEIIRINCDYQGYDRFEHVKSNIVNSKLSEIFDLSVMSVCECYANGITNIQEISSKVGIKKSAIVKYLKTGARLGLCDYNSKKASKKAQAKMKQIRSKPVKVFKNDSFVAEFPSRSEASRKSKEVLGTFFDYATISNMCLGKKGSRDGVLFTEA